MTSKLNCISSMATRHLLAELMQQSQAEMPGVEWNSEAVGGVAAARRVAEGEAFDLVVLASDAIDKLVAAGHLLPGTKRDIVASPMAIATHADESPPPVDTEQALKAAVMQARSIGFSTGPSGVALMALFERWGLHDALKQRLVQAPPGVPVASMIADRTVALGFQQLSELLNVPGVSILGNMPPGLEIITIFSGAVGASSDRVDASMAALRYFTSSRNEAAKRRHGMLPA